MSTNSAPRNRPPKSERLANPKPTKRHEEAARLVLVQLKAGRFRAATQTLAKSFSPRSTR